MINRIWTRMAGFARRHKVLASIGVIMATFISVLVVLGSLTVSTDPDEVFDFRCKTNGIIYQEADYLAAAMNVFIISSRKSIRDVNEGREKPSTITYDGENYIPQKNIDWFASPEAFIRFFPDCCQSDHIFERGTWETDAGIRMRRRYGKLAAFVYVKYQVPSINLNGKVRYFNESLTYPVGNCLEVYRPWGIDTYLWPMNTWLVWSWWRPRLDRLIVKDDKVTVQEEAITR